MMFGSVHHMSTAAGCAATSNCGGGQKTLPKARYGAYFSGMGDAMISREEEEYFAKKRAAKKCRNQSEDEEKQQRKGIFSKKLLGKLVRLISVKDFPLLAIVRTFPSRDSAKKTTTNCTKRRSHNASQSSSTLSGSFEPMPTIEEETDSELLQQFLADAECWEEEEEARRILEPMMAASGTVYSTLASSKIVQAAA